MELCDLIIRLIIGLIILASFYAGKFIGMQAAINTGIDCSKFKFEDESSHTSVFDTDQKEKYINTMTSKRTNHGKIFECVKTTHEEYSFNLISI